MFVKLQLFSFFSFISLPLIMFFKVLKDFCYFWFLFASFTYVHCVPVAKG